MSRLAIAVLLAGCGSPSSWGVRDGFLRAADGRAAILRGVNLSGAQKSAPYLDDKQPADYQRIRSDWGMNAIRFLMTWAAVEPEEGRYDDQYLDAVVTRLDWARQSGLAVVLDMHQDVYGEGFGFDGAPRWTCDASHYEAFVPVMPWFLNSLSPEVVACVDDFYARPDRRTHFIGAWHHVAERLAGQEAVIGFDVLNEPAWGSQPTETFERDLLGPFYQEVVRSVRTAAPNWVAFLEPSASRNIGIATSLPDLGLTDVMYAPHSYDAGAERGNGFDPSHRQYVLDNVRTLAGEAHALGAGLWIGEYGGTATSPGIGEYMTAEYDAAGAVAAGTMYWAYDKSDGYALLDPEGNERARLLHALVRPYPERVAGDPISYAFTATSSTFELVYRPDPSSSLPTEIAVPERSYPDGYEVECGGCRYRMERGVLFIDQPPPGDPATIVIR